MLARFLCCLPGKKKIEKVKARGHLVLAWPDAHVWHLKLNSSSRPLKVDQNSLALKVSFSYQMHFSPQSVRAACFNDGVSVAERALWIVCDLKQFLVRKMTIDKVPSSGSGASDSNLVFKTRPKVHFAFPQSSCKRRTHALLWRALFDRRKRKRPPPDNWKVKHWKWKKPESLTSFGTEMTNKCYIRLFGNFLTRITFFTLL